MLGAHVVVIESVGLLTGKGKYLLGSGREVIHHDSWLVGDCAVGGVVGIFPISGSGIFFNFVRISAARKESRSSDPSFAAWRPF
jgi:hypothetical protein